VVNVINTKKPSKTRFAVVRPPIRQAVSTIAIHSFYVCELVYPLQALRMEIREGDFRTST